MVTNNGPELVYQQVKASSISKRSLSPELLERFRRQDLRVFDLLLRYQAGEKVAEEMLAELLPAAQAKVRRLRPIGVYGRGDLRQEIVADVLHVARTLPLNRPEFVTRRLMLAAAKRLARRLESEWYRQLHAWYGHLERELTASNTEDAR